METKDSDDSVAVPFFCCYSRKIARRLWPSLPISLFTLQTVFSYLPISIIHKLPINLNFLTSGCPSLSNITASNCLSICPSISLSIHLTGYTCTPCLFVYIYIYFLFFLLICPSIYESITQLIDLCIYPSILSVCVCVSLAINLCIWLLARLSTCLSIHLLDIHQVHLCIVLHSCLYTVYIYIYMYCIHIYIYIYIWIIICYIHVLYIHLGSSLILA